MTESQYRTEIQTMLEQYYEKCLREREILLYSPDIPEEMLAEDADPNKEWNRWKLIPSTVTKQDLDDLEQELEISMPLCLRAFLSAYHHCFRGLLGRNMPDEPFDEVQSSYHPILIECGYIPFGWDSEGAWLRCVKTNGLPNQQDGEVYEIDHEILFDWDEETYSREQVEEQMQPVSPSLLSHLKDCTQ